MRAYGATSLVFFGQPVFRVCSSSGRFVDSTVRRNGGFTWLMFDGAGRFVIEAQQKFIACSVQGAVLCLPGGNREEAWPD